MSDSFEPTPDDSEPLTRERLLDAAGEVFAERGYHDATIREICGRAKANVASVNYHFGDKRGLYKEVLGHADRCAAQMKTKPLSGVGGDPEVRLRGFITGYVAAMLDCGRTTWHGRLLAREMMEPSPVLDDIVNESIRPRSMILQEIVGELLGPGASEEQVIRCKFSIIGQCLLYHSGRHVLQRLHPGFELTLESVETVARHITEFSVAAIKGLGGGGVDGKAGTR